MIRRSLWRQDLGWAGFLLALAVVFGLAGQWPLVTLSFKGGLPAYLEKMRDQRRQSRFQGVKTLNLQQAYDLFQRGEALFIDAREPKEYEELHLAGAINLPPERIKERDRQVLGGIAKDRRIVVYCGEVHCDVALKVAEKLQSLGFTRVAAFLGGFRAWDEAGYPAGTGK
jgi:rhodanese-related sulfurtransferase